MKILLIGFCLYYNLEHYIKMNLERMGYRVSFFGYSKLLRSFTSPIRMAITRSKMIRSVLKPFIINNINQNMKEESLKVKPNLVLSVKGEIVQPETIEWFKTELGAKTALWYPDDPRFFDSLVKHVAPSYDYVFTASEKAVERYRQVGVKRVYYLPFACEPVVHRKMDLGEEEWKKYGSDVVFVGTYSGRRGKIIKRLNGFDCAVYGPYWKLFKRGRKFHEGIYGFEMVKAFNAAKIVLNIHVESDLVYKPNMRIFEAAGCGSFLLTDLPSGIEKLFDVGSEVICYRDEKELIELIGYYLDADEERKEIALRGQERAYEEHTYEQRVKKLLEIAA